MVSGLGVKEVAAHVKKYLLPYSIVAILVGIAIGWRYEGWFKANKGLVSNAIILLAILTIYPSMIQLKLEKLGTAARKDKEIILSMLLIFVLSPVMAIAFSVLLPKGVAIGFVTSNVVPASSASIGYVLLAWGNIELATVLAVLSLAGSLVAIPAYLSAYASVASVTLPLGKVMRALVYTLVTPFVLGQITRYFLIHRRAKRNVGLSDPKDVSTLKGVSLILVKEIESLEKAVKPHLSLTTMASMLILIALLGASKAGIIVGKPYLAFLIIGIQAVMLFTLLTLITGLDKLLKVKYEDNAAIAFISATKNQSLAAAIAVMALGPEAAVVPALIPAVQAPVAIAYLHVLPKIRGWLISRGGS